MLVQCWSLVWFLAWMPSEVLNAQVRLHPRNPTLLGVPGPSPCKPPRFDEGVAIYMYVYIYIQRQRKRRGRGRGSEREREIESLINLSKEQSHTLKGLSNEDLLLSGWSVQEEVISDTSWERLAVKLARRTKKIQRLVYICEACVSKKGIGKSGDSLSNWVSSACKTCQKLLELSGSFGVAVKRLVILSVCLNDVCVLKVIHSSTSDDMLLDVGGDAVHASCLIARCHCWL